MRVRSRWALILCAVFLVLSLTSCAAPSARTSGVTLTIMGKKSDMEKSYMRCVFDRYREKTGNELKLVEFEDAEFEEKASRAFSEGSAPDILMHFHNADLNRFDVSANFLPLNDQPWMEDLTDSALAYCLSADGDLLGLPFWESSVSGCYYNKTLLDGLGLKPAATQAEFDMLCQALMSIGMTPICWPQNGCTWMYQFPLDPLFADDPERLEQLNGGQISYADIPEVVDMARWIQSAAKNGWFGEDYMNTGWSDIGEKLGSGEAVMTFIWDTWFYTDFEGGKYTKEDFALMPVFLNTVDGGTYEGGNLNMMLVNRNGEQVDKALEFLSFCAEPENYNAAFDGISTVSCFRGQTTNIQSQMVQDAAASIAEKERVSTAASRIVGYSADDVAAAFDSLLRGEIDAEGCVARMDEYRELDAHKQGT